MTLLSSIFRSLTILTLLLTVTGVAQTLDQLKEKEMLNAKLREEDERNRKQVEKSLETGGKDARANAANRNTKLFNTEKDLPFGEKKLLATSLPNAEKYEAFLRQPETGLCKILNLKETKVGVNDVRSQSAYPQLIGGGTFYSFAKRLHNADEWAQIHLRNGHFQPPYKEMKRTTIVNSGESQQSFVYTSGYDLVLFTELGKISLDEINLQHPALKFLSSFQPPAQYQEFMAQLKLNEAGILAGNINYKNTVPARLNSTYLMRSINYKRADEIIAFQVIHEDSEGNLHLLWKQIAHYPPPDLKGKPQK